MKLKNLIKQLQQLVDNNVRFEEYAVKFRGENQQEDITHVHTEGRTLILSSIWAEDHLNPQFAPIKEIAKLQKKIKKFKSDAQMALEDVISKPTKEAKAKAKKE